MGYRASRCRTGSGAPPQVKQRTLPLRGALLCCVLLFAAAPACARIESPSGSLKEDSIGSASDEPFPDRRGTNRTGQEGDVGPAARADSGPTEGPGGVAGGRDAAVAESGGAADAAAQDRGPEVIDSGGVAADARPASPPSGDINYCAGEVLSGSRVKSASPATLTSTLAGARAGDVILLEDGTYDGGFSLKANGTSSAPIVVRARNPGRVTIRNGIVGLEGAYNVIACLRLHDADARIGSPGKEDQNAKEPRGEGSRITRNWIVSARDQSNSPVVLVRYAKHARVDHNDIGNPEGNFRRTGVKVESFEAGGVRIDHNYFFNSPQVSGGEYEAIWLAANYAIRFANRTGVRVERNLFENWHGDNEVVAVKSSRNVIANNTFLRSRDLSLRAGEQNLIKNNVFRNAGMVTFGFGHELIGNELGEGARIRVRGGSITHEAALTGAAGHAQNVDVVVFGTSGGTIMLGEPTATRDSLPLPPKGTRLGSNSSTLRLEHHTGTISNYVYPGEVGRASGVSRAQVGPSAP
jgi:hypothetical protein